MAWSCEVLSSLTKGDADRWNGADADRTANEEADRRKAGDVTLQWGGTEGRRGGDDMVETTTKPPGSCYFAKCNRLSAHSNNNQRTGVFFIK